VTSTYQLKEKPAGDIQEDNSLQVFNNLVDFNTLDFINQGGKVVNYDGQLRILDDHRRSEVVTLNGQDLVVDTKYQIKSSAKRTTAYPFDIKDLSDYVLQGRPVFVFLVNMEDRIVYYEVVNRKYVEYVLGIDLKTTTQKTKTVRFHKQFTGNTGDLLYDFVECENIGIPKPEELPEAQEATRSEVTAHKALVGTIDSDIIYDIEALMYLHPLDEDDSAPKTSICLKLELEESDLDFYVRHMLKKGIIVKAGGKWVIQDVKVAKYFLEDLIERKGVDFVYQYE
jgi:hypothetical protein